MKKIIFILSFLVVLTGCNKKNIVLKNDLVEYKNITYKNENMCLTFYDDGKYSLYDCDSEPTKYPFDSEWECIYHFNKDDSEIVFDCKYAANKEKKHKINIKEWNQNKLVFEFNKELIELTKSE